MSATFETIRRFTLVAANTIAPDPAHVADHEKIADAVATVLVVERPLFKNDEDKLRTAALFVGVGYREGSLRASIVGDCTESKPGEKCKGRPRSFCFLQVHESNGGTPDMNEDLAKCVRASYRLLATSFKVCPRDPVAHYAEGGEKACESDRAKRISVDRLAIAQRVYVRAKKKLDEGGI